MNNSKIVLKILIRSRPKNLKNRIILRLVQPAIWKTHSSTPVASLNKVRTQRRQSRGMPWTTLSIRVLPATHRWARKDVIPWSIQAVNLAPITSFHPKDFIREQFQIHRQNGVQEARRISSTRRSDLRKRFIEQLTRTTN